MRYPEMAATRTHRVRVPRLDGGLNLDDVPTAVADNQITDCRNLWWHNGALRARPGLNSVIGHVGEFNIIQPIGEGETLFIHYRSDGEGHRRFYPLLQRVDGSVERFGLMPFEYITMDDDASTPCTAFGCHAPHGADYDFIFFFGSGEIVTYTIDTAQMLYADPYVPHVSVDGAPTVERRLGSPAGTLLEYPNRLCNQAVCTYSTDGVGTYFYIPAAYRGASMYATVTLAIPERGEAISLNITLPHTFTPATFHLDSTLYSLVTLGYSYDSAQGVLRLYGVANRIGGGTEIIPLPPDSHNNLRITLTGYTGYDPSLICRMTMASWFGGERSGVGGGARLFVAGDTRTPHRLCWSHVDNPLYFPAANECYVGDGHAAITAFGKQSNMLIIFKQHEIYAASYVSRSDPITEVLPNEEERQAYRAYFPITPLHPTVGCDCPDSVQLVNNKLVWMTSAGQLYMLAGVNRNSERNVRQITSMITPALVAHPLAERLAASGGEYDGRYMLAVGTAVYVLDCRSTAFNGFGQYVNENTALRSLVYYRWELPATGAYRLMSGGDALIVMEIDPDFVSVSRLEGDRDHGHDIPVSFTTKMYGCADPARRMSVPSVTVGMSDLSHRVRVTYHTDHGDYPDAAVIRSNRVVPDMRRITPRRITPNIHRAAWFGITCESDGGFAVTGLDITTRIDAAI